MHQHYILRAYDEIENVARKPHYREADFDNYLNLSEASTFINRVISNPSGAQKQLIGFFLEMCILLKMIEHESSDMEPSEFFDIVQLEDKINLIKAKIETDMLAYISEVATGAFDIDEVSDESTIENEMKEDGPPDENGDMVDQFEREAQEQIKEREAEEEEKKKADPSYDYNAEVKSPAYLRNKRQLGKNFKADNLDKNPLLDYINLNPIGAVVEEEKPTIKKEVKFCSELKQWMAIKFASYDPKVRKNIKKLWSEYDIGSRGIMAYNEFIIFMEIKFDGYFSSTEIQYIIKFLDPRCTGNIQIKQLYNFITGDAYHKESHELFFSREVIFNSLLLML